MDYSVVTEQLVGHSDQIAAARTEAAATLAGVRLDAAEAAMPGSLSAAASSALQGRFTAAADEVVEALTKYVDAARSAAAEYQEQEERSVEALTNFFGRA